MSYILLLVGFLGFAGLLGFSIFSLFKRNGKAKKSLLGALLAFAVVIVGGALIPDATKPNNTNIKVGVSKANTPIKTNTTSKTVDVASKGSTTQKISNTSGVVAMTKTSGALKVHYINVGQADSILIQQGNHSMLIDAGKNESGAVVKNYIQSQGVNNLEFLIGTHPHEDHIGGMDYVINSLKVGKVYLPKVTSNTKTFKDVVNAIKNKGMKVSTPRVGESFKLGDATCTIIAPNSSEYKDLNNYSIVVKIQFGSNSFLFTGDAEAISEMEMVNKGLNLNADVLKVGHHGSNSSSCSNFLSKVNPKYAVVSVGEGNTYKHPHKGTMDRLKGKGVTVYRTDQCGTVVAVSDGKNIKFNTKAGNYTYRGDGASQSHNIKNTAKNKIAAPKVSKSVAVVAVKKSTSSKKANKVQVTTKSNATNPTVYVVGNGKKYHSAGCRYLHGSGRGIPLRNAKGNSYTPCKVCHPMQ